DTAGLSLNTAPAPTRRKSLCPPCPLAPPMSCAGLGRTRGRHTLARKLYESPHHRFPAGRGASTKHPRGWRSHPHQVSRTTHPTLRTLCRCVRLELDTEGPKSGVTPRRGDEDRQDGTTYRARLTWLPL